MVDVTEISAIVAAAGVLIGVVYYVLDMRHQMQVRQTELILGLYKEFGSIEFQEALGRLRAREYKDFDDYEKQYGWAEAIAIGTFFEGAGLLLKRKLVDIKLVDDLFTTPVKLSWKGMKPIVYDSRKHWNSPAAFEWFEYLYNELKKREQKLHQ